MASIVIVHAAFGGGWEWREVASLLRARGHDVFTPSLTGHGERVHLATADTGLDTHIQDIVNVVRYEDLQRVVLASQSYGGMVITGVADRIPERIAHLVYMNALVPENGQSAFDLLLAALRTRFEDDARGAGDGWLVPAPSSGDDAQIAAFERGRAAPSPLRMLLEPIRLDSRGDARIQRTYIWSTDELPGLSGIPEIMRPFAERAKNEPAWRFHQVRSIPSAHIRAPETIAELFDEAAKRV